MSKPPTFIPMQSTVLKGMHYEPATSKLTLQFASGSVHEYSDVPMERAEALRQNASPGSYFGRKIRGQYASKER